MNDLPQWNDATRAQITAARPDISTWLSANAGSGKTRVLTDRVARLLLTGVEPQHILCLTYTKAAASEMQNRLFKRLGEWAMMEDDALRAGLRDLGVLHDVAADELKRARTLFAQAIETPGGLKIQTIHSFCAALLRRFPLEARVSPQFKEIEDRAAELLRAEILDTMAEGPEETLVADLARHYTGEDFGSLTQSITGQRELFTDAAHAGDLNAVFGLPTGFDVNDLPRDVMDVAVARWMPDAIGVFAVQKAVTMTRLADGLRVIDFNNPTLADLEKLKALLLTQKMELRKSFPTKDAKAELGPMLSPFEDLAQRTFEAHDLQMCARNVARTGALHRFATRFIALYEAEKQKRGWLDFDDLILRARALLNDPKVAAWVLYRIDGGIDHILVDEAQDTSPRQWDVIEKLTDEFSSGAGAREVEDRTLFVVGDKKQSIYSFQGADPREFDLKRESFREKLEGAQLKFQNQSLDYSFRSSAAILGTVDQTFNTDPEPRMDERLNHLPFKEMLPGRVDLWPLVEPNKDDKEEPDWTDPVDRKSAQHHTVILADQIAAQIKYLIDGEHFIPDEGPGRSTIRRRIRAGDFLILVQGRTGLFSEIIRACKAAALPIAGADRLKVGAELAVRDIGALLSFLATPDDSLSLAIALRSPLFGWDEQALFTLAHERTEKQLWQSLRSQTERYPETLTMLRDLRGQIDFLRPYDLIERILTRHEGRRHLLARLGAEAEDGIDALLAQALAYEQTSIPSLTGFLEWMQADDLEIKRQIDSASDQIRVMSVHGAKGLEAPIVILPDTGLRAERVRDDIITLDGVPIWKPNAADAPAMVTARLEELKTAQAQERLRLLYVAMTRAEKWLIVAAAGKLSAQQTDWYQMIEGAMGHLNAVPFVDGPASGLRHQAHDWDAPEIHDIPRQTLKTHILDTVFEHPAPAPSPRHETLTPSKMEGAKALAGEAGLDEEEAKAYGSLVHLLLEHLAALDPSEHTAAAEQLTRSADPIRATQAVAEAQAVLSNAALAPVFAPDALAEVAVTAALGAQRLYGIIDRLIVTPDRILAVDFKTNRTVPDTADACPEGLLRQMGAYAHALGAIYPDRKIETAILWTRTGTLMMLPDETITSALERAGYLDAGALHS